MIIVVDNYDSFTYNLVQYLGELGADLQVYRNDKVAVGTMMQMTPKGIVISPGPCTPKEAGISCDVIKLAAEKQIPLLGVCLGHQCVGSAFGATVRRNDIIMHGKTSMIHHTGEGVLEGLPNPFEATRYHSLIVDRNGLPDELKICAETEAGEIMGLIHKELPIYGVQFHPESILTETGMQLLANFLKIAGETS